MVIRGDVVGVAGAHSDPGMVGRHGVRLGAGPPALVGQPTPAMPPATGHVRAVTTVGTWVNHVISVDGCSLGVAVRGAALGHCRSVVSVLVGDAVREVWLVGGARRVVGGRGTLAGRVRRAVA